MLCFELFCPPTGSDIYVGIFLYDSRDSSPSAEFRFGNDSVINSLLAIIERRSFKFGRLQVRP